MRQLVKWLVSLSSLLLSVGSVYAVDLEKLAKSEWLELKTPNFYVVTDAELEVADKFLQDLESFRFFIAYILNLDMLEGVPPVKILAVEDRSNFKRLDMPEMWGGVFSQSLNGSFAIANIHNYQMKSTKGNWGKGTLLHEYVHYAVASTFNRTFYPPWYNEGMAEYLSTFRYDEQVIRIGDLNEIGDRFSWLSKGGAYTSVDLEDLFKAKTYYKLEDENKAGKAETQKFYARATAAVHYFKSTDVTERAMRRYIVLINTGYEIDQAFKEAFGKTFEEVDQDIRKYLNGRSVGLVYKAGKDGFRFPAVKPAVKTLDESTFYHHITDFLMRFSFLPMQERVRVLSESLKRNPDNPDLKVMLADLLSNGSPEKSEAMIKDVLARHPNHVAALNVYGDLFYKQGWMKRTMGLDGWGDLFNKARGQYRRAAKSDPFYARSYAGLGRIYVNRIENDLLEEGAAGFDSARFFANQHELLSLYYSEALLRLRMHDHKNAISTFRGFINLSDDDWSRAYGRFVYEALVYRELSGIQYRQEGERYIYTDGSIYAGDWRNGKPNGKGQLVRANGATFKGTWSDGVLVGKGEFIASNKFHYTGDFNKGEITGRGILVYPPGQKIGNQEVKETRGEFFNAFEHGEHEIIFSSGDRSVARHWMGYTHGQEQYFKTDGTTIAYDRVFSNYKLDLGGDVVYSGGMDEEKKPHGGGTCQDKKSMRLYYCVYEHGLEMKMPMKADQ
jgi:hypothetical protein